MSTTFITIVDGFDKRKLGLVDVTGLKFRDAHIIRERIVTMVSGTKFEFVIIPS